MQFGPELGWLKRLMPQGLYARAVLILFLPVFTISLVVTVMFLQRHFEDVTRQMTTSTAREISFVARRIERSSDRATARVAGSQLAAPLGLTLRLPAEPVGDARLFYDISGRVVADELRSHLPQVTGVDLADIKLVVVGLDGPFGLYSLSFPRSRVSASNPHQLLVLLAVTAMVITAISGLFLRNQLRPIRRLARAAQDYGKGRVIPFRPGGAAEIRSAGTAFLEMRNRLERLAEQRGVMLSGISHDLRTPLTRLQLGLSMLATDTPPDPAEIEAMRRDVEEMEVMVNAFLAFARDAAHDSPAETLAVLPFVEQVVADARRAGQDVRLGETQGASDATATFRPDMLRRALENLLGNAARYGSRAELSVAVTPRQVRLAVEDDGPGIPEDRLDEAVRPFARLDPARSRNKGEGAGLGLAIAADTARAHGGQLRLSRAALGGLRAELVIAR